MQLAVKSNPSLLERYFIFVVSDALLIHDLGKHKTNHSCLFPPCLACTLQQTASRLTPLNQSTTLLDPRHDQEAEGRERRAGPDGLHRVSTVSAVRNGGWRADP
jgi:hypothetical protein